MAKKAYIGIDNVARKIKNKAYIGIDDVARKVKRGYIGVGGVARPFFSSGELVYHGTATDLSTKRADGGSTSIGNFVLFSDNETVDTYNKDLVHSLATPFSTYRRSYGTTSNNNYALFGGGLLEDSSTITNKIDTYNKFLTRSNTSILSVARYNVGTATVGEWAIFAGGASTAGSYRASLDAFNSSLTRETNDFTLPDLHLQYAATAGDYGIFVTPYANPATVVNSSLTSSKLDLTNMVSYHTATTSIGEYALFGGGKDSLGAGEYSNICSTSRVIVINSSLTQSITTLAYALNNCSATTINDQYAIFAGGYYQKPYSTDRPASFYVTAFNQSLVKTVPTELTTARYGAHGASVGDYGLFAGGIGTNYNALSSVEVYAVL